MDYRYKNEPFAHQRAEVEQHRGDAARALFWEMGTGKTFAIINSAAWLFLEGKIDALFVVAPNSLHRLWANDETPKHLPTDVASVTSVVAWDVAKCRKPEYQSAIRAARTSAKFLIATCSYHGTTHPIGEQFCRAILTSRRCMLVADESTEIKSPGAAWTKRMRAFARLAPFRRVLSGTPVANSPFDLFSQLSFLDASIWSHLGVQTAAAFRTFFGNWIQCTTSGGAQFPKCTGYKNLDELRRVVSSVSSRVTKAEALDLPPQLYTTRRFALTPAQRNAYEALREECFAELATGTMTAILSIVKLTRFQQIVDGFAVDDDGNEVSLCDPNPRLSLLLDVVRETEGSFIVWSKYKRMVTLALEAIRAEGIEAVRYDGDVSDDDREVAKNRFQVREARAFVGNPGAGGMGLTLTASTTTIYVDNSYKLPHRLQSESRQHRFGQTQPVLYVDLVAEDSIDEAIVRALREKRVVASEITGDQLLAWI